MSLSIDPRISNIHPFYRIFLLYIEPILALSGAYLALFHPAKFLLGTAPSSLSTPFIPLTLTTPISTSTPQPQPIDPVIQFLSANIGALYILFAINEAIVLRLTRDYSVWKVVVFAMLVCDVGHIWGVYQADPTGSLEVMRWTMEEWINNGILAFGAVLRIAFLGGVGYRK
ncbi:hypothetical protein SBOR_6068 [Sclerotinia borealis F-4128]|uniref:DUF7704 domain-containing protein n=1 Tax=Sclerotinia borealis (strain F-4128) TaxID=1432307 RepID=W9CCD7_SCLBF|nr:hypothetical protein SBOR_6068 [Sclerotinia borealis F-4128]